MLFTNEESNDVVPVPANATYGLGSISGTKSAGRLHGRPRYGHGEYKPIPGMGRHNHENQVLVPGGWDHKLAFLSGDDTFSAPSSQLYMYLANNAADVLNDSVDLSHSALPPPTA